MQTQTGIAGPYDPLYPDVTRMLRDNVTGYLVRWMYFALVSFFYVEQEWGDDPIWVHGVIRANKTDIAREAGVPRKSLDRGWAFLTDAGMVKELEDGTFQVPYYRKKKYDTISAGEIRDMNTDQITRISRLEDLHSEDLDNSGGEDDQNNEKVPPEEEKGLSGEDLENEELPPEEGKTPPEEGKTPPKEGRSSFLKHLNNNSLSLSKVISGFYRGIGQSRISKEKRERGLSIGEKLRADGFSLADIAFAVEWTLKNAKEEPYDFAIIEHTIGQALAGKEKMKSEARAAEEREKVEKQERLRRETEEERKQEMDAQKAALSPEERESLRSQAESDLMSEGLTSGMINDFLINMRENEIIRKKLEGGG